MTRRPFRSLLAGGVSLQEYLSVVGFDERTRIEGSYSAAKADPE